MNRATVVFALLLCLTVSVPLSATADTTKKSLRGHSYLVYQPDGITGSDPVPLLVMLHGCTQSPREFARASGMNRLAEKHDFLVLYPDQTPQANRNQCWNWFRKTHTDRGSGEAGLIAGMVRTTLENRPINPDRIYLAGFSAGGAMASALAAAYPDLFAAAGIHSGLEYRAADTIKDALAAMNRGGPDPVQQGRTAHRTMGKHARAVPTMVLHGRSDTIVEPINGEQATRQALETIRRATRAERADSPGHYGLDDDPDRTRRKRFGPYSYRRKEYRFADGRLAVVSVMIEGMGHAWAGGQAGESYVAPAAPDASRLLWEFFNRHTRSAVDARVNTPPVAALTASALSLPAGETVTVTADGSDIDGRIVERKWMVDGKFAGGGRNLQRNFETTRTHRIGLTVTDNDGATDQRDLILTVTDNSSSEPSLPELPKH